MSNETPVNQPNTKPTHSLTGIYSAVFGIIPICSIIFWALALPGSEDSGVLLIGVITLGAIIIGVPLSLILGIIALRQKDRKKMFPIIGVSLSALILILVCGLIFSFLSMQAG